MMRGQGHAASGRHKAAIKEFKAALRYDSGNAQATTGLQRARAASRVRTQTTKVVKARKNPVTAGQNKLDAARALAKEAKAAKRASNLTLAEKLYRQCLKTHAGMASCRADLAVILMARSKRCEALKHMRKYVRSHPGSGKAIQFNRLIEQFEPQCN
jgi:thioredoxin-like negative regulator of GroEL